MMRRLLIIMLLMTFIIFAEAAINHNREGIDISSIHSSTQSSSTDRSECISADITGHVLTITFNDNVGIAHIVIKDSNGVYIDNDNVISTPEYATFIVNDSGYYRMDISLSNCEQRRVDDTNKNKQYVVDTS